MGIKKDKLKEIINICSTYSNYHQIIPRYKIILEKVYRRTPSTGQHAGNVKFTTEEEKTLNDLYKNLIKIQSEFLNAVKESEKYGSIYYKYLSLDDKSQIVKVTDKTNELEKKKKEDNKRKKEQQRKEEQRRDQQRRNQQRRTQQRGTQQRR